MKVRGWILACLLVAVPAAAQSPKETLDRERKTVGTPMSKEEDGRILNATALKHGLFLLSKPGGNNCPLPGTGEPISCDFLVRPDGGGFDVLSDQENKGTVVDFNINGEPKEFFPSERMIKPFGAAAPATPSQPPLPAPVDLGPLTSRVSAAEGALNELRSFVQSVHEFQVGEVKRVDAAVGNFEARILAIEARPTVTGCTAAINVGLRVPISCTLK